MSTSKPQATAATGPAVKPILAERFKTKLCRNWLDRGCCPYQFRCMFAHGEEEMRTKQMNLDDGLVTEDAIRAFRTKLMPPPQQQRSYRRPEPQPYPSHYSSYRPASYEHYDHAQCECEECVPVAYEHPPCECEECLALRTHDPYAPLQYNTPAPQHCECPDCVAMYGAPAGDIVLAP